MQDSYFLSTKELRRHMTNNADHLWFDQKAEELSQHLTIHDDLSFGLDFSDLYTIGGLDVSYGNSQAVASLVVLRFPDFHVGEILINQLL